MEYFACEIFCQSYVRLISIGTLVSYSFFLFENVCELNVFCILVTQICMIVINISSSAKLLTQKNVSMFCVFGISLV